MFAPLHQGNVYFIDYRVLRQIFCDPLAQIPGLVCFVEEKNIARNLSPCFLISIQTVAWNGWHYLVSLYTH